MTHQTFAIRKANQATNSCRTTMRRRNRFINLCLINWLIEAGSETMNMLKFVMYGGDR
jgi:hypothetical protein